MPWLVLNLLWRGVRNRAYWRRWPERFGSGPQGLATQDDVIWVHAVSVGEVQAATALVNALRKRFPQQKILLTTFTATGSERVRANFPRDVMHCYVPYDLPGAVQLFLARVRPSLAVIMETELWPNIFHYCHALDIPIILANARMSARSARGYQRITRLISKTLTKVSAIAAQSQPDAKRLTLLGAPPERVHTTGSIKFDIRLPGSLHEEAAVLRRSWGVDRAVWIAASTHEGEEKQILDAFDGVRQAIPQSLLVLVPRHPERFTKVTSLCHKRGYSTVLRSEQRVCEATTDVFIGDSMGELALFYAAADVAFVGGSLVPVGGHNLLEPAALGIATVTGPFMFNFEEINRLLCDEGVVKQISNTQQLSETVVALLNDANLRYTMGEKGRRLVEQNRGALAALVDIITPFLKIPSR